VSTGALHEPDEILLGFTRALRSAGVAVTHDRATSFLEATALVGADDAEATFRAGRATLCGSPDDLVRFEHVFAAWFGAREQLPRSMPREKPREISSPLPMGEGGESGGEMSPDVVQAAASDVEVLRHAGGPAGVRPGGGGRSTCTGPCARRCARWASRAGSSTGDGGPPVGGWCSWSTSLPRCVPMPTPSCGWHT
jgi:hypothetical protein